MQSPFPGMDPWLELYWRGVHASLIIRIQDQLQPQLPEPLVARPEEDVLIDTGDGPPALVRPDVEVAEGRPGESRGLGSTLAPPVAVAEPTLVHVPEEEVVRYIEIIDLSSGGRVVTAI